MTEYLVSIIVPVYKVEEYLDRCVGSIVNQTYQNLEIILVDDGSPDQCPQMCDEWAERDSRIRVIHQENGGAGSARNIGIAESHGSYMMFVDSDDWLCENAVQNLLMRCVTDETAMAVGRHIDIYDDGITNDQFCRWMKNEVITKEEAFQRMGEKDRFAVYLCVKMFKREVFADLSIPPLSCGEDCWLFPYLIERCDRISLVDELIYYYFQRAESATHQMKDSRLLDDIEGNLNLAHYLYVHGFQQGAHKWFEISVNKALLLCDKKAGRKLIEKYYQKAERSKLVQTASLKLKVKWICLEIPFFFHIVYGFRKIAGRKHA